MFCACLLCFCSRLSILDTFFTANHRGMDVFFAFFLFVFCFFFAFFFGGVFLLLFLNPIFFAFFLLFLPETEQADVDNTILRFP